MSVRKSLQRAYWLVSAQFGLDLRMMLRSVRGLPRFFFDFLHFRSKYVGRLELLPCLHDWYEEGGATKNEYFWQDLLVARMVFDARPEKHVDVGSRVDGFVAHVASFRDIEVFDVRPITSKIPGITFKQADLMKSDGLVAEYCDSLSCLHALEHFGLGRYGDPIDPKGFAYGLVNLASLLKPGGLFYLSVPIGVDRVEFNANRVFDPRSLIMLAVENRLDLSALTVIKPDGVVESIQLNESELSRLASQRYVLGIFVFLKLSPKNS